MKNIVSLLLAFAIFFCACSCSRNPEKEETTIQETTIATTTGKPVETTAMTVPTVTEIPYTELLSTVTLENYPVVDGSTAAIPLAIGLVQKITGCTEAQAEESIDFNTTDASYYALAEGKSELLLVYAPSQPTIDELDVFSTMDVREIGLDALVFIVNEDNPIDSLTSDQIRDIYSGKITNWSEVGGEDLEIVAFQRPELSGSQTLMLNLMMKDTTMMASTTETISAGMADIIEDISAYDNSANAIGYSVFYYAKNMYTQPGLKFIAVDDVIPSNETINNREYGFINAFYGVLPLEPNPLAEAMLTWLLTEEGQQLLTDCGYVPIVEQK
jgi:hypothetical protein